MKDLNADVLTAVAKHYSDITKVKTWLLDVTLARSLENADQIQASRIGERASLTECRRRA